MSKLAAEISGSRVSESLHAFAAGFFFAIQSVLAIPAMGQESKNLSKAIAQVVSYDDSGRWNRDISRVVNRADAFLLSRNQDVKRPALVLDIDETSLSN